MPLLLSLAASNFARFSTQKTTKQVTNNSPEKTTIMGVASTNTLPSKRKKDYSDDNITTTSNNSDTNDNNLVRSDQLLKAVVSKYAWNHSPVVNQ